MIGTGSRHGGRTLLLAALLVGSAVALAGCAAGGAAPTDEYAGPPKGVIGLPNLSETDNYATWLNDGDSIAVVLFGSSTCPKVGRTMTVRASNSLRVEIDPIPSDKVCTADLVPHTTVWNTPSEVTTTSNVTIEVEGSPLITLQPLR